LGLRGWERDFEVIEEYYQHGVRRFRIRVRGSNVVINVAADSLEEALEKARRMAERIGVSRVLRGRP